MKNITMTLTKGTLYVFALWYTWASLYLVIQLFQQSLAAALTSLVLGFGFFFVAPIAFAWGLPSAIQEEVEQHTGLSYYVTLFLGFCIGVVVPQLALALVGGIYAVWTSLFL